MDVIEGRGPAPSLLVWLVAGLPDTSLTTAMRRGGWKHLGWGYDREIAAATYDLLALQTEATGNWKKIPKIPRLPRPAKPESKNRTKPKGITGLYAALTGGGGAKT